LLLAGEKSSAAKDMTKSMRAALFIFLAANKNLLLSFPAIQLQANQNKPLTYIDHKKKMTMHMS
jgi:hypothetical protein